MRHVLPLLLFLTVSACSHGGSIPGEGETRGRVTLVEPKTKLGDYLIRRTDYDRMLERGASYFIRQIKVTAIKADRQFIGFRLDKLFPNEPYFQPGEIRLGDVVQRVNGLPIGRPEQFMQVWTQLKHKRELVVQILRNGEPLIVTWHII